MGIDPRAEPVSRGVRPGVLGEGMDKCSRGARRGMGPSTCTRVAEIMSGRAIAQQGLARTCKDRAHNGHTGGAGRGMVAWRMSPYEQRRGGNAPPGGFRGRPGAGNARSGQRGSWALGGHDSRVRTRHRARSRTLTNGSERRLRQVRWKEWKRPRTRRRNLRALGISETNARQWASSRKGYWRIAGSKPLAVAMPNGYWTALGLQGFSDPYRRFRDAKRTAGCGPARPVV